MLASLSVEGLNLNPKLHSDTLPYFVDLQHQCGVPEVLYKTISPHARVFVSTVPDHSDSTEYKRTLKLTVELEDKSEFQNYEILFSYCMNSVNQIEIDKLRIYPNPASDYLTIETDNPKTHTIKIHSLNGQLLYRTKGEVPTFDIDLSSFQKGLYFITVRSRDYVRMEKIIIL